ncbi:MAG: FG-GAP-like repeat-containing protein [Marinoscillum sp.]
MRILSITSSVFLIFIVENSAFSQGLNEISTEIGLNHLTISFDLVGGGLAFLDYNNDGFEDLAISGGGEKDRLFRNLGDGKFLDVTEYAGLKHDEIFKTMGINAGDINNDGFKDIVIVTESRDHNLLYLNNGNGSFKNISVSAGFGSKRRSLASIFFDANLDGFLDIYIVNWVNHHKSIEDENGVTIGFDHDCYSNQLYINNGDLTFTEMSFEYGVDDLGCGVAATSTDFNNDHLPDLYLANDFGEFIVPNSAFKNNYPSQKFTDEGNANGLGVAIYGMGISTGDVNGDGKLDYYSTNIGRNVLLIQEEGVYRDRTTEYGAENALSGDLFTTSWGTVMTDLDHDGYEDLVVANGFIPTAQFIKTNQLDTNRIYMNQSGERFIDQTNELSLIGNNISRGLAITDYDNDGDMDIGIVNLGRIRGDSGNMSLYRNDMANGNWIKVKLEGVISNRDGYGAKVMGYHQHRVFIDEIQGGSSCSSLNSSIAHLGLGSMDQLDSLKVIWPGGRTDKFYEVGTDQTYLVVEGEGIYRLGCADPTATNYDPDAQVAFGCYKKIVGCMDPSATNYNPLANSSSNCTYGIHHGSLGGVDHSDVINIFPTVVKDYFVIEKVGEIQGRFVMTLYDSSGRVVLTQNLLEKQTRIERCDLKSGIYIVLVRDEQQSIRLRRKIILN